MQNKIHLSEINIRRADLSDVPGIARVHVDVWNSTYTGIVPQEFLDSRSYENIKPLWERTIGEAKLRHHVFVAAALTGEVIGFTCGGESRSKSYPFDGELFAIYLLKRHQGSGIGRRLFEATIGQLEEDGFNGMLLWVLEENPARKFYDCMGGIVSGHKIEAIGGKPLKELAYGWTSLASSRVQRP